MRTTTTLIGTVGTVPETGLLPSGTPYANFRLAVNGSRFDRERQEWVSTTTSWFDIKAYDQLATAMGMSVGVGDPLVVVGELSVRAWENEERHGTSVELTARSCGHNLKFGTARFTRTATRRAAGDPAASDDDDGEPASTAAQQDPAAAAAPF